MGLRVTRRRSLGKRGVVEGQGRDGAGLRAGVPAIARLQRLVRRCCSTAAGGGGGGGVGAAPVRWDELPPAWPTPCWGTPPSTQIPGVAKLPGRTPPSLRPASVVSDVAQRGADRDRPRLEPNSRGVALSECAPAAPWPSNAGRRGRSCHGAVEVHCVTPGQQRVASGTIEMHSATFSSAARGASAPGEWTPPACGRRAVRTGRAQEGFQAPWRRGRCPRAESETACAAKRGPAGRALRRASCGTDLDVRPDPGTSCCPAARRCAGTAVSVVLRWPVVSQLLRGRRSRNLALGRRGVRAESIPASVDVRPWIAARLTAAPGSRGQGPPPA